MVNDAEERLDSLFLAEFCCWTVVVLCARLDLGNGPAVSTDQFVIRTVIFGLAVTGAIRLRVTNIVRNSAKRRE